MAVGGWAGQGEARAATPEDRGPSSRSVGCAGGCAGHEGAESEASTHTGAHAGLAGRIGVNFLAVPLL